jgi:hypothetical protein
LRFRNSRKEAEQKQYAAIKEIIQDVLGGEPSLRTFNVEGSTTHRISAPKAP